MKLHENIAVSESGFMFDPNTGDSYSLNITGKEIISMLKAGKSEEEIKKIIFDKYEIDNYTLEYNFYDFIETLKSFNLISTK